MATREKYDDEPYNGEPDCAIEIFLDVMGRRWKGPVLHHLLAGVHRFGELRRVMPYVTQRVLASHLRALERDGIIERTVFAEMPPRVEYSLTPLGDALRPILAQMAAWGDRYARLAEAKETARSPKPSAAPEAASRCRATASRRRATT